MSPAKSSGLSAEMRPPLSKDTRLCISLAARPTNIGTRFHNYLYEQLGLDFIYKAFTTTDLAAAIGGVRALGIRGCSVLMPYKSDVIALVDGRAVRPCHRIGQHDRQRERDPDGVEHRLPRRRAAHPPLSPRSGLADPDPRQRWNSQRRGNRVPGQRVR